MAATKSAGRVSIRVLPDSTRFKQDLEKSLRRIENQLKAKIEAELYLSRESLAKLKREIESLVIKIKPTVELDVDQEDIAALKAKIEKMKPKVDVLLGTVEASRRIAVLSRDRSMNLFVNVKNLAAMKDFTRHIQGLSGLNVLRNTLNEGLEFFRNIDTNALKLSKLYTKVASIGAAAISSVGSIAVMTGDIAAMGNIGILAPAWISALGISVGILVAAFKDMKTVLGDLGPVFSDLQQAISAKFWGNAEGPIRRAVDALMPIFKPNIVATAGKLGTFFGTWADSFRKILTQGKVDLMFGRMNKGIEILQGALYPLTNAFTNLGLHGSKYFARFSTWIVKISKQFDKFIERSAKNGDLDRWTERAIQGFKDFGNVLRGTVRVFNSITDAAKKAKLPDMGDLGVGLNNAADIMNSPRFQKTLTTLFQGAKSAVDGIVEGVKKLGPAIETAAPSIQRVFETVGSIGTRIGGMLATIISDPIFLKGLEQFFTSIETSLKNLEPAAKPFADSLGGALRLMGKVLESVSEVAAAFAIKLGPVLDRIGNQFETLVTPLKNSLLNLIDVLTPILNTFNTSVVTPFIKLIKEQLLPLFDNLVKTVGPSVEEVLKEIGKFVGGELTQFFKDLNGEFKDTDKNAKTLHDSIKKILDLPKMADPKFLMPGFQGGWLTEGGGDRFKKDWENLWRPVEEWSKNEAVPGIKRFFEDMMKNVDSWIKTDFGPQAKKLVDTVVNQLGENLGIKNLFEIPKKFEEFWKGLQGMFEDGYNGFKEGFQKWLDGILPFDDLFNALGQKGPGGGGGGQGGKGMGVSGKITPEMIGLGAPDADWLKGINDTVNKSLESFWASVGVNIQQFGETVASIWNTFWGGFGAKVTEIWTGITTWIGTKASEIATNIASFIETVRTNWDTFWNGLPEKISAIWTAIVTWIVTKASEIWANISKFIADVRTNWDTFWNSLPAKIAAIWAAIVAWIRVKIGEIVAAVMRFLGDVLRNMQTGWENVKRTVQAAWDGLVRAVGKGVGDAIEWVRGLPGKASAALSGLGETLKSSGASLIGGFINGMTSMIESARQTAAGIVEAIANFFPHSPAKEGAFSGRGYTTHSGRALVKDFAGGMMDNMNKVRSATKAITNAVKLGSNMDLHTDLGENGVVVDRRQVTIQNYNPVAEPTSRTIEKASNTLRMAGAI